MRVIDEEGNQLGVMAPRQATEMAKERGYDLVEVAGTAAPPVCRIMDYGRFLYEKNKKEHEARKHQKGSKLKEVKMRPRTDQHDYDFKKKHVVRFLGEGDKVKVVIMFRGREMAHQEIGQRKLQQLVDEVAEYGAPEKAPSMEGRWLSVILAPRARPKPAGKAKPDKEKAESQPQAEAQ